MVGFGNALACQLVRLYKKYIMAGNENSVVKYLLSKRGKLSLNHLGVISSVANPGRSGNPIEIKNFDEVISCDSHKKADIYLNHKGVSIKQRGSSFAYNRIQRASILAIMSRLGVCDAHVVLRKLDDLVIRFHEGDLNSRDRPWCEAFDEEDFRLMLRYLMMEGSVEHGVSDNKAEYILSAPAVISADRDIECLTFDEYFERYKKNFYISLRRVWRGQDSNSEHRRAVGLCSKPGNSPWCFKSISGEPRSGWMSNYPSSNRMTAYILFITLKP
jgi:hypothetical protein